ncbi:AAA family ATPase [Mycolicibacillus parakoreensis]|uniref:AAA family ATPase n=1 Tax=Mycolicibacillus parakoreensis TaxID=1069221 RepID=A0ABY3U462_9MYCO|nr:AAA family ATPase [Mycolicibacillus parakoreensis]MCV7314962.1 AAA family ATPase [Mycolicibacillus parakoreensis]ULN53668.1 AAA family ATPase [Mycolicibacillus parakoreensis]
MRLQRLTLAAYGRCTDVAIEIGETVTVVLGANEAGKSTALDALNDLLWGIPRQTARASEVVRSKLRIDAELDVDGTAQTVVRKSGGLVAGDPATPIPPPWDPANQLTAQWWRTRLGIDHADLRRGGQEVFAGTGDIAELIFAARQGRSARELLAEITDEAAKLFKADGRARNVELRLAKAEYSKAVQERDDRLTRADVVVEQRVLVDKLQRRRRDAKAAVTEAARRLKRAEENRRVIDSVLDLGQAQTDLQAIAAEGERLSPADLAGYLEATEAGDDARRRLVELDAEIEARANDIAELAVDDRLLADRATLDRLQSEVRARIEELHRADQEFGPEATTQTARLQELLHSIGVAVDDVDQALARARVRVDHAATLDDLADRIEALEERRRNAKSLRDKALEDLAAKGIGVDITESAAPSVDAVTRLCEELDRAHGAEATAETLLAKARDAVITLRDAAPAPRVEATLTRTAVVAARRDRDARWAAVRELWLSEKATDRADRAVLAADLDTSLARADTVADDEAVQRSRVAAHDARIEAHVEGLDAARREELAAEKDVVAAADHRLRVADEWAAVWARIGLVEAPGVNEGPAVAGLLATAHAEHAAQRAAGEELAELAGAWAGAAELVGLSAACTTAAWRTQSTVFEEIEVVQSRRVEARDRDAQARRRWETFLTEAVTLMERHGVLDETPSSAGAVEQGLTTLAGRLTTATAAAAKRTAYQEQIEQKDAERTDAQQAHHRATESLRQLAETYSVGVGPDLDVLAERAARASDPAAREAAARRGIEHGLDPGSDLAGVLDRLADDDRVSVDHAVDEAAADHEEARDVAESIGEQYTIARDRLAVLEDAGGAADAEAEVAVHQANVAQLAESWAILTLQRHLLEAVLAGMGCDDTRPLLDHAGRMLERLTEGRWVALHAHDDGGSRQLKVIRADAQRFGTSALSEGTRDQVFLALRLAAVAELHNERVVAGEPALPLVLDDVLMAFDETRMIGALNILVDLAPRLQVIVFTHHRHVADAAAGIDRITVSELPEAARIDDPLDAELVRAQA